MKKLFQSLRNKKLNLKMRRRRSVKSGRKRRIVLTVFLAARL